jgi:hypothetical protein
MGQQDDEKFPENISYLTNFNWFLKTCILLSMKMAVGF